MVEQRNDEIVQPQYQAPQYQQPQYQAPQYQQPQYQAPQYQAPQYQAPQYQAPQYQAPQFQSPNSTSVTVTVNTNNGIPNGPVPGYVQPSQSRGSVNAMVPEGLEQRLSMPWHHNGKSVGYQTTLESLISRICKETGWTKGPSVGIPISPVIVSVDTDNRPAYEGLDDIGTYIGRSADVVVTPSIHTITIHYPVR